VALRANPRSTTFKTLRADVSRWTSWLERWLLRFVRVPNFFKSGWAAKITPKEENCLSSSPLVSSVRTRRTLFEETLYFCVL